MGRPTTHHDVDEFFAKPQITVEISSESSFSHPQNSGRSDFFSQPHRPRCIVEKLRMLLLVNLVSSNEYRVEFGSCHAEIRIKTDCSLLSVESSSEALLHRRWVFGGHDIDCIATCRLHNEFSLGNQARCDGGLEVRL